MILPLKKQEGLKAFRQRDGHSEGSVSGSTISSIIQYLFKEDVNGKSCLASRSEVDGSLFLAVWTEQLKISYLECES